MEFTFYHTWSVKSFRKIFCSINIRRSQGLVLRVLFLTSCRSYFPTCLRVRHLTYQRRLATFPWQHETPIIRASSKISRSSNSRDRYISAIMPVAMDTQQQNFWIESINKEAAVRFAWQLRYSKQFAKDAASTQKGSNVKEKGLHIKSNISETIKRMEESAKKREEERKKDVAGKRSPPAEDSAMGESQDPKKEEKYPLRDMRPSSPNTRALLYNGISAHGEGRFAYLKKRALLAPEEKYEFPILSSCEYGWKILQLSKNSKPSEYGRTCIVRDTFYRNSGIIMV